MENDRLNKLFMRMDKRAEGVDRAILVQTFVDMDPLMTLLSTRNHQIIFGRRGTGKTHGLLYLNETKIKEGDLSVYVDMRTIGSTGGLYADTSIPRSERGTRLLMDVLGAIHESLLSQIVSRTDDFDLSILGPLLDSLTDAITEVKVVGTTEITQSCASESTCQDSDSTSIGLGEKGLTAEFKSTLGIASAQKTNLSTAQKGTIQHRIHFGKLSKALKDITSSALSHRVWILLDEWSAVPMDLQPLLADLVRRSLLPVPGVVVKIGAIEHRSLFQEPTDQGDYLGIELGADIAADVNLDDFMVFDNDAQKATHFFTQLIWKHVYAIAEEEGNPISATPEELISAAFSRRVVFEEYVRASEGVPRDAINILSQAARLAGRAGITVQHLRTAARRWYETDKQAPVNANRDVGDLLSRIVNKVIDHRKTRAFLFESNIRHPLIDDLFDKRVLHILKRNISAKQEPGIRYDVFKIDYGCYVDLLTTAKAPQGLLPFDDDQGEAAGFTEVPPDDYRAIRRAILRLEDLNDPIERPVRAIDRTSQDKTLNLIDPGTS